MTGERAFVRLPTEQGDAYFDIDHIVGIVPTDKGTLVGLGSSSYESIITTATPEEVVNSMSEAWRKCRELRE